MSVNPEVAGDSKVGSRWPKRPRRAGTTLGQAFDPKNNALNVWRLVLATGVIFGHTFALTGHLDALSRAGQMFPFLIQFLSQGWVDGFFAVSGFLITGSWLNNPRLRSYLAARGLRIFPGLWVCLIVIAFVFAPITVAIQRGSVSSLLLSSAPFEYVLNNSVLNFLYAGIAGTPRAVPWPGVWNGSTWTLVPELMCYIAVAVFGLAGLLKRRWLIPSLFVLMLVVSALVMRWDTFEELWTPQWVAARFAIMFLAGALLHQYRDVIPARWSWVAICLVIVFASCLLPNYRLVAAIPFAYAILVSGALIHNKRLRLQTDLSYGVYIYAWPVQQMLVVFGLASLNPIVFSGVAAVATLPFAAVSWFVIEKPALSLKSRLKRKSIAQAKEAQREEPVSG
jgi:peptidoglycan/LPS O-acetylase OafA/YrhL